MANAMIEGKQGEETEEKAEGGRSENSDSSAGVKLVVTSGAS